MPKRFRITPAPSRVFAQPKPSPLDRPRRTAWEIVEDGLQELGDLPDWVVVGQQVESKNEELTAYIAFVEVRMRPLDAPQRPGDFDDIRVWLSWKPFKKKWSPELGVDGKSPQPWLLKGFLEYWRPAGLRGTTAG
jgi:hypothetical protein